MWAKPTRRVYQAKPESRVRFSYRLSDLITTAIAVLQVWRIASKSVGFLAAV